MESWEGGKMKEEGVPAKNIMYLICHFLRKKPTFAITLWEFMSLFGTAYMTDLINCFEHSDPGSNFLTVRCFSFSCVVYLKKK